MFLISLDLMKTDSSASYNLQLHATNLQQKIDILGEIMILLQ